MKQKNYFMSNNAVSLHRVLKASPEKIYRAFTEAPAIASWLPPYGYLCTVHEMNVEKGGSFKMSFQNFSTGNSHSFGGTYTELKPGEFLKYTDKFDDPNLPEEMVTSVWLRETMAGTEIKITQEGIPAAIPVEMCYLGWQESLEKLAKLVEPVIPDA
ncbi:MAG TPA: SRPBCC family protein [Puia sp.]|nr:SRPBCC family protein [Puia sp.]